MSVSDRVQKVNDAILFNKLVVNNSERERVFLLNAHKYNMMSKMMKESIEYDYLGAKFDDKTDKLNIVLQKYLKVYSITKIEDIKYLKGCMYMFFFHNFTGDYADAN
jgi:hypothetical protein